jgi:hypothetical protein
MTKAMKTKTKATILKTATEIAKSETTLRDKWQALGVDALTHLKQHGDTSICSAIYDIMGEQSRYRPDFSKWMRKHGLMSVRAGDTSKGEPSVVYSIKDGSKPQDVNVTKAESDKFWVDNNKNKDPDVIDGWKLIMGALSRFETKSEEFKDNKKVKVVGPTAAQIKALRDMVEKNQA